MIHGEAIGVFAKRRGSPPLRGTLFALLCALFAATNVFAQVQAPSALAQGTIFVVRHAERADTGAAVTLPDPSLSDTGRARAVSLAALLKDAGVTAIFVSELKRTQETAAPLANSLALVPTVVAANDLNVLMPKLRSAVGNVLVVGHSNTVPALLDALGVTPPVIADAVFDNLFIVVPNQPSSGVPPRLIRLHYR